MSLNVRKISTNFLRCCFLMIFCFIPSCIQAKEVPDEFLSSEIYHVTSTGMEPNILSGDTLIVDSKIYRDQIPARGDIILFIHPNTPDNTLIKRIIGLPKEKIEINNQTIWIDGQQLEESYILEPLRYSGEWTLGEQEYFVLSDNRNNGSDSHNWGGLPLENILGKVTHVCNDVSFSNCKEVAEDEQ